MATKARFYRFELCDGHGSEARIIAAPSKADAENVIAATISPFQKVQNIKSMGWLDVQVQPNEIESGVEYVVTVDGKSLTFTHMNSSHTYLSKQFAKETKNAQEFLRKVNGDEF